MTLVELSPPQRRETFQTSRLLDFAGEKELSAQTGHAPRDWPLVVLKELLDNALDACEDAGTSPVITIIVNDDGITVADNGPGVPDATVAASLDFSIRVSSRAAYVAPDRGAQGNALKTIIAMPFALDARDAGKLIIDTPTSHHAITMRVDAIEQQPVIQHDRQDTQFVRIGTSIKVPWPASSKQKLRDAERRFLQIARDYTWLNPHLTLTADWFGERAVDLSATCPVWPKWRPKDPTCLRWYTPARLGSLVASSIKADRQSGRNRTVREFLERNFRGMKSRAKQSAILEATGLARQDLTALVRRGAPDESKLAEIQRVALQYVTPVKPKDLGVIGREHLRERMAAAGGDVESFVYRKFEGTTGGVPWVVEAGFSVHCAAYDLDSDEPLPRRRLITGVNWSAGIVNPFREIQDGSGLDGLLADRRCDPSEPVILFLHMACARVEYTDRGKSAVVLRPEQGAAICDAITFVTKAWDKQRASEERDADRQHKRQQAIQRARVRSTQEILKEAAYSVMESAYRAAAGSVGLAFSRQVMYKARGPILEKTGRDRLDDQYFCQTLLPNYIRENPTTTADWDVVFDPRGNLIEPHTDRRVRLGTIDVRDYLKTLSSHGANRVTQQLDYRASVLYPTSGPRNRFGAILFIEKEGFIPLFDRVRLANRFDVALMSTKGLSNTASRLLVDELFAHANVPLLVLHDFDKAGFSIYGTFCRDSRRYEFRNDVDVRDLGLRLADVQQCKLESESVFYGRPKRGEAKHPRENLLRNGATEAEVDFLVSDGDAVSGYRGQRVELNAFGSDEFIEWIQGRLVDHGVQKVIPDQRTLEAAYRRSAANWFFEQKVGQMRAEAERFAASVKIPHDLDRTIRSTIQGSPQSWDGAVSDLAAAGVRKEREVEQ
jgi:DNA topoisomerase VI subunit B